MSVGTQIFVLWLKGEMSLGIFCTELCLWVQKVFVLWFERGDEFGRYLILRFGLRFGVKSENAGGVVHFRVREKCEMGYMGYMDVGRKYFLPSLNLVMEEAHPYS